MQRVIWHRHGVSLSHIPASLSKITNKNAIAAKERREDAPYIDRVRAARGLAPKEVDDVPSI
jgi:hypothetical protein